MSSPSQKHGSCGHIMASFDSHCFCARCREKGKGSDPCVAKKDCNSCNILSELKYILRFIKVILQSVLSFFIIVFKSVYRSF